MKENDEKEDLYSEKDKEEEKNNPEEKLISDEEQEQEQEEEKKDQIKEEELSIERRQELEKYAFNVSKKEEIIKVENCAFTNDVKEISTFYFCSCSNEEFFPICEACALECHKSHNPTQTIKGIYTCKCGECNHQITEENEKIFNERKKSLGLLCFFPQIMKVTPNIGFFRYKEKTYCGICMHTCVKLEKDEREKMNTFKVQDANECMCSLHFEHNLVNLNLDFSKNLNVGKCFENLNFNILAQIPLTKEKYITTLVNHIKTYIDNSSKDKSGPEQSKIFFSDFINGKILECFSLFNSNFENKFFYIENYFEEFDKIKLIELTKLTEDITSIDEGVRGEFFTNKFHFAELIFSYLIRSFNNGKSNLWNVRTIVSMNLYQRFLYCHQGKYFFKFKEENDSGSEKLFREFTDAILKLYEVVLHCCEGDSGNLKSLLFSSYFPSLNRMIKYLIKINLLIDDQMRTYYDLVFETVLLWYDVQKKEEVVQKESEEISEKELQEEKEYQKKLEQSEEYKLQKLLEYVQASQHISQNSGKVNTKKKIDDSDIKKEIIFEPHVRDKNLKSVFYIIKSIFYTLLYENDRQCIKYFKGNFNSIDDKFIFAKNQFTDKICKIFMLILRKYYRKDNLSKTVIYDYYIQKTLELLIKKGENFYIHSLENLKYINENDVKLLGSDDFFKDALNDVNKSYLQTFNDFCDKLGSENRKVLNYSCRFTEYLTNSLAILKDFEKFVRNELIMIPDINLKYLHFIGITDNETLINKITDFQKASTYTLIYTRIEEFMQIYNMGKAFNVIDESKTQPALNFVLTLLFLLVYRNHPNLALLMNIKPEVFVGTFIDTPVMMFNFLERISEMFYIGDYKFNTFYFYSECLCMVILDIEKKFRSQYNMKYDTKIQLIENLGHVLYLTNKIIDHVSINHCDYINIIDRIQHISRKIESDTRFESIKEIANSYLTDVKPNPRLKIFFVNYFVYLSKLIQGDFYFFTITSSNEMYLVDMKSIIDNLETLIFKKITDFEEEYALLRYYFALKLRFNITTNRIENQAIRMFKNNNLFDGIELEDDLEGEGEGEETSSENEDDSTEEKKKDDSSEANENNMKIDYINSSLINLDLDNKTNDKSSFEEKIRAKIDSFKTVAELLFKVVKRFSERIKIIISNDQQKFTHLYEINNFLLNYYEQVILRPMYKLINLFMLHSQFIKGRDCLIYQALVFEVLKVQVKLYRSLIQLDNAKNDPNIFSDTDKKYYRKYFHTPIILKYENISLKKNLTTPELESIIEDIDLLYELKYYYIADIFQILIKNVERVLYTTPKSMETIKTKISMTHRIIDDELHSPPHLIKLEKLIQDYTENLKSTVDNDLTLFSALEASEKEMDIEIGKELLMYLLHKMCDDLTDENFYHYEMDKVEYREPYLSKITIRHFKLQNSYALVFLNALFYNYSEHFQNFLRESIGKYFDPIFVFLVINIMFACNINENTKVYTFDQICDYNNEGMRNRSICFDICTLVIKFIQNMCEGHNQIFQQRFFNYKLNIDSMTYIDLKEEKERDFRIQKLEDAEYYSIYNIDDVRAKKRKKRREIINRRPLMLNSLWFKDLYDLLNKKREEQEQKQNEDKSEEGKRKKKADIPELKIIDILQMFITQLQNRKEGKLEEEHEGEQLDEELKKREEERKRKEREEARKKAKRKNMGVFVKKFIDRHKDNDELRRTSFRRSTVNEDDDKDGLSKDNNYLKEKKYSFLNFLINNMRLIVDNLHITNKLQSQLFKETQKLKSTNELVDIYDHFSNLVLEMTQGTNPENFDNYYRKLTKTCQVIDENDKINYSTLQSFAFIHQCIEISKILWKGVNLFNDNLNNILIDLFTLINNIITQEISDVELIEIIIRILPPERLINVISYYLKGVAIKHLEGIDYEEPEFEDKLLDYQFDKELFGRLEELFRKNVDIHQDEFFTLSAQMYLFIKILADSFQVEDAVKIIDYENKEIHDIKFQNEEEKQGSNGKAADGGLTSKVSQDETTTVNTFLEEIISQKKKAILKSKKSNAKSTLNNLIVTAKFFKGVIKKLEFMIENDGKLTLKPIYFIVDPRVFYIDQSNIDSFFYNVDRSSSITKLKGFIESLNSYEYEVKYKYETFKKQSDIQWMYETDYKNIDLANFYCSAAINFLYLLFLDKGDQEFSWVNIVTKVIAIGQIILNIVYLVIFYKSKYKFNVVLAKSKYQDKEMGYLDSLKVYLLDTFLFAEEVYLMILIMLMGFLALISEKFQFFYSLQLLSVVKFVETIKIIVISFQMQIGQLLSILGFLLIFIFFYANISYTFFKEEFVIELDEDGATGNICSSLLECTLTYFNHGVRSGGGIGDILPDEPFKSTMYWVRFLNDFLFFVAVVLMLLNMINGVIVSTFSEIREQSNFKEEDEKNKCFICNIDRVVFERLKIVFEDHQNLEHNIETYIQFLVGLKLINEKDLDATQSFIIGCLKNQEIKVFPVGVSSSTGFIKEEEEAEGDEEEE